ncbi:hypothetical protein PCC8801_3437 [Rippkaea orientalis PCC 8801]|uniref:Uncharacterized protein n=1 Tax=Rippkaea orientalis (strain PCC 8801 / RF-1) TaxID=41431 RepID=B7K0C1_RIPO1|nr:hypothetical protein [Rippkaea orientalis]ACK67405.1 hypothetical protein PCC8801_3437 [Rippkaea orientalis PCC 8801]
MNKLTGFLYARPSFAEGIARLIDFGNTLQVYNTSFSDEQADFLALASDWYVLGDDLRNAMNHYNDLCSQATDELLQQAREELLAGIQE